MGLLRDIREVLGALTHRKSTRIFCPRCGSPEIGLSASFDAALMPRKYVCKSCGYAGPIVMELEKEEK